MANSDTIRNSRERKELLARYATAAGNLYGVIGVDELVEVFNRYEEAKTDAGELRLGLSRLLKTDDDELDFSLFEDMVTGADFLPEYKDDRDKIRAVRREQAGKPRYLPDKAEFLRYADCVHYEPREPYDELAAYIMAHKLTKRGAGLDGVEGDLVDLREKIQTEQMSATAPIEFFQDRG